MKRNAIATACAALLALLIVLPVGLQQVVYPAADHSASADASAYTDSIQDDKLSDAVGAARADETASSVHVEQSQAYGPLGEQGRQGVEYIPGTVLVGIADDASLDDVNSQLAALDYVATKHVSADDVQFGYMQLDLAEGVGVEDAVEMLSQADFVEAAQPDFVYHLFDVPGETAAPAMVGAASADLSADDAADGDRLSVLATTINDADEGAQWMLGAVNAYKAWDYVHADHAVTVAVLDSGADVNHEDLRENILGAYSVLNNTADVTDLLGHGTHVAGIIAAEANNGLGVAGVSYNANVMPVQVVEYYCNKETSKWTQRVTSTNAAAGVRYVIQYAKDHPEDNVRVINISFGGETAPYADNALLDALVDAHEAGLLVVCAAGNGATSTAYSCFPCDYDAEAIGVISVKQEGNTYTKSEDSNYNMIGQETKDLSAPGTLIYSTAIDADPENSVVDSGEGDGEGDGNGGGSSGGDGEGDGSSIGDGNSGGISEDGGSGSGSSSSEGGNKDAGKGRNYLYKSGTSMAAPCVSGVAALLFAADPSLSAAQVKQVLRDTARDLNESQNQKDTKFDLKTGWGMVDAKAALEAVIPDHEPRIVRTAGSDDIGVGDTLELSVRYGGDSWEWSVADRSIASVRDGVVVGLRAGTTSVIATEGNTQLRYTVNVYDPTIISKSSVEFGADLQLGVSGSNPAAVWNWSSSDKTVATVSFVNGVPYAHACGLGEANITVALASNPSVNFEKSVTVVAADVEQAVVTGVQDIVYTGNAVEFPDMAVAVRGVTLTPGVDYEVEYEANVNAGTGKAVISGKGNYGGQKTVAFEIDPAPISGGIITLSQDSFVYDASSKTPTVSLSVNGRELEIDEDFSVTWEGDRVAVGTHVATITGQGNYTGALQAGFEITRAPIASTSLEPTSYVYDGTAKEPLAVVLGPNGEELSPETDYEVEYSENVNVGTALAKVIGKGNYTGELSKEYAIAPASLEEAEASLSQVVFTYDGSPAEPDVSVTLQGEKLACGKDYDVEYHDNVDAGEASVRVVGKGNYTGEASAAFTIERRSLDGFTVNLPFESIVYNGKAQEPDVVIADSAGSTLNAGSDYRVDYRDNVDVGDARVIVTGEGNYAGELSGSFAITCAPVEGAFVSFVEEDRVYDGVAKEPVPAVVVDGKDLVPGADFTVEYSGNSAVGEAHVTVVGEGNYVGRRDATFRIIPASMQDVEVVLSQTSFTYDGAEKQPSVVARHGSMTLEDGVDYELTSGEGRVDAGTYDVVLQGKGNYEGATGASFTIEPASIANASIMLASQSYVYDGVAKEPQVVISLGGRLLQQGRDYIVTYTGNNAVGTASATAMGVGNYTGVASAAFSIEAPVVSTFAGDDRFATARKIIDAELALGSYKGVVVVAGDGQKFPDALSAAGLAGMLDYPLVMVNGSALTTENKAVLADVKKANGGKQLDIVIVGGPSAVSESVEKALSQWGKVSKRINGADRYETNALVYDYGKKSGKGWSNETVFMATGMKFPDALAIAPYLVYAKAPILLVRPSASSLSDVSEKARPAIASALSVVALGGTNAVSDSMLKAAKSASAGKSAVRLSGANRYETAAKVVEWEMGRGLSLEGAGVATGKTFPDALSSGFLLGKTKSVLCLVSPKEAENKAMVSVVAPKSSSPTNMLVLGGTSAVPTAVRNQIATAAGMNGR